MSPVRYELRFYIPEEGVLHSYCRGNLKSYTLLVVYVLKWTLRAFVNLA
jgi:hypothetical protein